MMKQELPKTWHPAKMIGNLIIDTKTSEKYALVVLNRTIKLDPNHAILLWKNATTRILVDGGANRWMTFIRNHCHSLDLKPPDLVTGDFDSITISSLDLLKNMGSTIRETPDQNETDFTKALIELRPYVKDKHINKVIVLYDMSGRIDHIMGSINTLYKAQTILEGVDVFILCQSTIYWLLNAGEHCINIPKEFVEQKLWCALVPMSGKTVVSSTGLKWNLNDTILEFGGLVSTSNTYADFTEQVTIKTNKALLWSMGIGKGDDN